VQAALSTRLSNNVSEDEGHPKPLANALLVAVCTQPGTQAPSSHPLSNLLLLQSKAQVECLLQAFKRTASVTCSARGEATLMNMLRLLLLLLLLLSMRMMPIMLASCPHPGRRHGCREKPASQSFGPLPPLWQQKTPGPAEKGQQAGQMCEHYRSIKHYKCLRQAT
jgi:hypothetical protein